MSAGPTTGSGWRLEYRAPSGLVAETVRVWNELEGERESFHRRYTWPALDCVLVGPRGGEQVVRRAVRKW